MENNEESRVRKHEEKLRTFRLSVVMMLAMLALAVMGNMADRHSFDDEPMILTIDLNECGASELDSPDFVEVKDAQFY
ncbi:hypothetical protein [Nitrosomonas sp. Nm58]|uniref:hypothetical protein n=1 Tax=Nitrosomonas sp. Nm58 TaxID=200126 RepID=UPI000899E0F5|nr:hypothetical protein [Nitrosomonas sp. Nm58]SDY37705.1 hypothetical protein SAMN05421754_100815 [Nitrosomonas sp. Nm58]